MLGPVSPTILERYELKYIIPESLVEPISQFISHFCEMDYYSQISPDKFYMISSLYFDTPTLQLFRIKENGGAFNPFSLRVRSYGEKPKAPYFFETKEKEGDFCRKLRGKAPIENWSDILLNPSELKNFDPHQDPYMRHWLRLVETYNCQPTILTQYRRKAYLSTIDSYARVTFDKCFRYQLEPGYTVIPDDSQMTNYDHPEIFEDPGSNVILELKCERKIPVWLMDLVRHFQLTRCGFSKYRAAIIEVYSPENRLQEFTFDRVPASMSQIKNNFYL